MIQKETDFNILHTSSMDEAAAFAFENTAKGKSCVLSPAAPSYNLYKTLKKGEKLLFRQLNPMLNSMKTENISVNLETVQRVHFIGIGGIGMSALVRFFVHEGSGCQEVIGKNQLSLRSWVS